MKKRGISVCFVVKNGMINGYPFWESLESCLPIADEIVISEGMSRDNTFEVLNKFKNKYGDKVNIFRTEWSKFSAYSGEVIALVSEEAMKKCSYEWIYYLQADEVIHEDNVQFLKSVPTGGVGNCNSIYFKFAHLIGSWKPLPQGGAAYSEAIRMVKNIPSITLLGDGWTFTGSTQPVFPSTTIPKPIYHLGWVFPKNIDQKNIEQAKIYSTMKIYQDKAASARQNVAKGYNQKLGLPIPTDFDDYPKNVKRLVGAFEYTLPEGI